MAEAPRQPARRRRSRHRSAVERVRDTRFPVVMRGYDRQTVDRYVAEVAQLVAELEATQTREGVVQRALDEIGEQTSGILQRAHETAEEIAARSRSQAEGRIQRAEREADAVRREADAYSEEIVTESRRLWEDRKRLIEDMRQLADEVLAVADDALERVQEPRTEYADDTTAEAPQEEAPPPSAATEPPGGGQRYGPATATGDARPRGRQRHLPQPLRACRARRPQAACTRARPARAGRDPLPGALRSRPAGVLRGRHPGRGRRRDERRRRARPGHQRLAARHRAVGLGAAGGGGFATPPPAGGGRPPGA